MPRTMKSASNETKLLTGLIGAGIQRSLSPALQEEEARQHGLRMHYQLFDLDGVPNGIHELPVLITDARAKGFAGLNITYPCKQTVIPLLDSLSEEAQAIGAVNTVVFNNGRTTGHNTDGSGWSWGFRRALPYADLARVVVLGAGGAGSACADAVLRLGAAEIIVIDRDAERAVALAKRLNSIHGVRAATSADIAQALRQATGLIHATPSGMEKSPGTPFAESLLRPQLWVSEVVYVPLETELLKAARRIGCKTMDGGHMNVGQAADAFQLFTGLTPNVERMDAHFRRLVAGAGGGAR